MYPWTCQRPSHLVGSWDGVWNLIDQSDDPDGFMKKYQMRNPNRTSAMRPSRTVVSEKPLPPLVASVASGTIRPADVRDCMTDIHRNLGG